MMRRLPGLLALIGALLPAAAPAQPRPSEEERERIRIRVGMTVQQQKELEAIFNDSRRQEQEAEAKMRELYKQLYDLYNDYDFNREQARQIRREIGKNYHRRMMIHAETQEKLRKLLTKEQFDRLTAMWREQMERWRQRGPGRGPRP